MAVEIDEKTLAAWAEILLNHSLGGIQPEDVVMIKGEHITWPLVAVLQDKIWAAGAVADVNLVAPDNDRGKVYGASAARHGSVSQIKRVPAWQQQRYDVMTKYIEILGAESPALFAGLPEETARALNVADEPYKNTRLLKPWVLTLFPTPAFAQMEEMDLERYADVVVQASVTDPQTLEALEAPIAARMQETSLVRVVTRPPGTDRDLELRIGIEGRSVIKCLGHHNVPDGEVYTSPDANTVEGEIFVDMPVFYNGETIEGVYLRFEGGVIQEYRANRGSDALTNIIETDAGSKRLGEVALGTNQGLKEVLRHPLFVEKVGGTLHIAIGASYPHCFVPDPTSEEGARLADELAAKGVLNRSAQHVDIVTDFRPGGAGRAVYLDDTKLEVQNGAWMVP